MSKEDKGVRQRSLVNVVAAQSIKGHGFAIGEDLSVQNITELEEVRLSSTEKPYRIIDSSPVFHDSCNKAWFNQPNFDIRKVHLWEEMYHPRLVLGSYGIGGTVKFYVDTRVAGFYLLWTVTRVDSDEFPGASYDMVAWTPRRKGDNIHGAGFRMTHAALLELLFVKADEWKCEDWAIEEMSGYGDVSILLGACSITTHKTQAALKSRLAAMPEYLQPLYEEGASVTGKDSIF
jgi:hypothetical protein